MKLGLSLSPGGLMLPYHMGVLQGLQEHPDICPLTTPIAGSSAGAIATMAHGCGIDAKVVLEKTINVSDQCHVLGGARGRLLPLLQEQMDDLVTPEEFERLSEQHAHIGIAYTEVFPKRESYVQTSFEDRQDLFQAVSWSCTFPFFATNFPCALDLKSGGLLPRLMVDGFFSVSRDRFGCPDFLDAEVDRTIAISTFPKEIIGIDAFDDKDCISPPAELMQDLFRIATQASSREDLTMVYEQGIMDAEAWYQQEVSSEKRLALVAREQARSLH